MALTSAAKVKEYLGVSGTSEDALLSRLVDWASDLVHSYCGRIFTEASYDEYYDGDGTEGLLANQYPISTVTSLEVDGIQKDVSSYTLYGQLGLLKLKSGTFPKGKNNVRLQYTAGYSTIPNDLEQVAIELVALKYYDRGRNRLGIEAKDGISYAPYLPKEIKEALDLYKRYRL
ncbi:MAG: head-tail connector protein [Candidatus Brocadiales bacterium]